VVAFPSWDSSAIAVTRLRAGVLIYEVASWRRKVPANQTSSRIPRTSGEGTKRRVRRASTKGSHLANTNEPPLGPDLARLCSHLVTIL
jgi:hypothetical protein